VVTILDMNRFKILRGYSRLDSFLWRTVQPLLLRNTDRIVAISENTRRDLIEYYQLPAEKIQVIYPAVSSEFRRDVPTEAVRRVLQKTGICPPYVLSVGGLATHKNVYTALRAFCSLVDRGDLTGHTFVIVGGDFHTPADHRLRELAAERDGDSVLLAGVVAEEDLPAVYAGASLFVYPSLYEGFGIAPLEAMACGVPVLASRSGSLPEVLADAALVVEDVTDVEAVAEGMLRLLTDSVARELFKERGLKNTGRFSWAATAQQTLHMYRQLAGA